MELLLHRTTKSGQYTKVTWRSSSLHLFRTGMPMKVVLVCGHSRCTQRGISDKRNYPVLRFFLPALVRAFRFSATMSLYACTFAA